MIIFLKNETGEKYIYENGISMLEKDSDLNKRLFPESINDDNVPYSYKVREDSESKNLFDVIMLKVNVKNVGSFYTNFSKDTLDNSKRKKLMNEVRELSSIDSNEAPGRKEKVTKLLKIMSTYGPIFMTVEITNNKEEVLSFMKELSLNYPVLIKNYIEIIDFDFGENEDVFVASEDEDEDAPTKVTKKSKGKAKAEKTESSNGFVNWFKNNIIVKDLKKNAISYIFAIVYPLFISAVTILVFSFFNKNSVAYAIIMMVFILVFLFIMFANNNSFFKGRDLLRTIKTNYPLFIAYLVSSVIGIGLGVLVAYLVNDNLLKSAEDPEFSYTAPILVAVFGTLIMTIALYFVSMIYLRRKEEKK